MSAKFIAYLLILSVSLVQLGSGSSIPIWEFQTRNEKLSYLYSTFAKLVSDYCRMNTDVRNTPVNQCKRDLLTFGYEKLQSFSDGHLDILDPYQRGANELIWSTIMRTHNHANTIQKQPLPTANPSSIYIISGGGPNYPKNPLFDDTERKHNYAMDMDIAYGYGYTVPQMAPDNYHNTKPQNNLNVQDSGSSSSMASSSSPQTSYLSGPLVFRVRPDGTPVEEDKNRQLPRDEDLETFQFAKHHKVATISPIKQRKLASINRQSSQQQQQQQQTRRQYKVYQKNGVNYYRRSGPLTN